MKNIFSQLPLYSDKYGRYCVVVFTGGYTTFGFEGYFTSKEEIDIMAKDTNELRRVKFENKRCEFSEATLRNLSKYFDIYFIDKYKSRNVFVDEESAFDAIIRDCCCKKVLTQYTSKIEPKIKKQIKKKRKRMPRILKFIYYLCLTILIVKFTLNIDKIILFLLDYIAKLY